MKAWKEPYKRWVWDMDGKKPDRKSHRTIEREVRNQGKREIREELRLLVTGEDIEEWLEYHRGLEVENAWACYMSGGKCPQCWSPDDDDDTTEEQPV